MRELNQMDLEVFIDPEVEPDEIGIYNINEILKEKINFAQGVDAKGEMVKLSDLLSKKQIPNKCFAFLLYLEKKLLDKFGLTESVYVFRALEPEELPHYSKGNVDLEIKTSYGYVETCGNAYRTDYDLSSHSKLSGKDLSVIMNEKRVLPHVVEASMGLDRMVLALIDNAFEEGADRGWNWLRLKEIIAPYKYAILPLQNDDKLLDKARMVHKLLLEKNVECYYTKSGSIGKRYAKADEIGVPYCITIDYTTLKDDTVTIRDRDTTKQERKSIAEIL